MKIVMIAPSFWPEVGGVERHILGLSQKLIKNNHKVTIITPKGERHEEINVKKINIKGLSIWWFFIKNKKLFQKADIIHCHDYISFLWYLPLRFLMPRKKVFVTFHGWEGKFPPDIKTKVLRKLTEKLTWGNICIGKFIEKWYGQKADLISYGAIDLPPNPPIPINKQQGVFIGRLAKDAGIKEYIKALIVLKEKNIDFKLDVYGDGDLRGELEKMVKNNDLRVNFKGMGYNHWEESRNAYWAFVSGYLAILEAMSWKKAIVSVYDNELKKDYLSPFSERINICSQAEEIVKVIIRGNNFDLENNWDYVKSLSWKKLTREYLQLWSK